MVAASASAARQRRGTRQSRGRRSGQSECRSARQARWPRAVALIPHGAASHPGRSPIGVSGSRLDRSRPQHALPVPARGGHAAVRRPARWPRTGRPSGRNAPAGDMAGDRGHIDITGLAYAGQIQLAVAGASGGRFFARRALAFQPRGRGSAARCRGHGRQSRLLRLVLSLMNRWPGSSGPSGPAPRPRPGKPRPVPGQPAPPLSRSAQAGGAPAASTASCAACSSVVPATARM